MRSVFLTASGAGAGLLILFCVGCDLTSSGAKTASAKTCAVKAPVPTSTLPAGSFGIRNGQDVTSTDYAFVGMLYAQLPTTSTSASGAAESGTSRRLCSGTLVCPNVVLTAAHCFNGTANANLYYFLQGDNPTSTPVIDTASTARGVQVQVLSANGAIGAEDMALLQLDRNLIDSPPPIWESPWADPGQVSAGPLTTIVGYGTSATVAGVDTDSGTKKVATMRLATTFSAPGVPSLDGLTQLYPPDGIGSPIATSDNACAGDSGGAALIGNGLYGVLTKIMYLQNGVPQTTVNCQQSNVTLITPIPSHLSWIQSNMAAMCTPGSHITVYNQSSVTDGPGC